MQIITELAEKALAEELVYLKDTLGLWYGVYFHISRIQEGNRTDSNNANYGLIFN